MCTVRELHDERSIGGVDLYGAATVAYRDWSVGSTPQVHEGEFAVARGCAEADDTPGLQSEFLGINYGHAGRDHVVTSPARSGNIKGRRNVRK